jgi:hypothetical protein
MFRPTARLTLAVTVLVAGLIACSGGFRPPARPVGKTDFTVTSATFVTQFKKNPGTAHNRYRDKVVELTGKLVAIGNNREGQPEFWLEGPDPAGLDRANCRMATSLPWSKANPGQTVTVKGRADPTIPVARLLDCEIVTVAGDPAPRLTADEFARRTTDPELRKKQGEQRYLVVSGEIDRIDASKSGLFLKTQTGKALIHFSPEEYRRLGVASWQPGQRIEVIGMDSSNAGLGWLVNCLPMDEPK